jgi:hypothetical protein
MATLSEAQRAAISGEIQGDWSRVWEQVAIKKSDVLAAVAAIDSFFDTNAAAINNALPAAAKAGLTTAQKARLLMLVVRHRYLVGV